MVRREDEQVNNDRLRENAAGIALTRNPGVAMLWVTRQYEVFWAGKGPLVQMGDPERVEWFCEGRFATRAEVEKSVAGGLPSLMAIAAQEYGGIEELGRAIDQFHQYLPPPNKLVQEVANA